MAPTHLTQWHTALKRWRESSGKKYIPSKDKHKDEYDQVMQIYRDIRSDVPQIEKVEQPAEMVEKPAKKIAQPRQKGVKTIKERVDLQKYKEIDVQIEDKPRKKRGQ